MELTVYNIILRVYNIILTGYCILYKMVAEECLGFWKPHLLPR